MASAPGERFAGLGERQEVMDASASAALPSGAATATEAAKASARGGLVAPVIFIILISILTSCVLVWVSGRVLNDQANAIEAKLARSMLQSSIVDLQSLAFDVIGQNDADLNLVQQPDGDWAARRIGQDLTAVHSVDTAMVIDGQDRTTFAFLDGKPRRLDAFGHFPASLHTLVDRARRDGGGERQSATGVALVNSVLTLMAVTAIPSHGSGETGAAPSGSTAVLVLARSLNNRALAGMGTDYALGGLGYFPSGPPQGHMAIAMSGVGGNPIGHLAWRNRQPGDLVLWWLLPSLSCALLAVAYLLYQFFRSTDLIFQRQEHLVSSLRNERELRKLKTRLVSMISHELRTPLATIRAAADLLDRYESKMTADDRRREIEAIRTAVVGLVRMMEDVLALGRSDSSAVEVRYERFKIGAFCRELWDETVEALGARHRLVLRGAALERLAVTDETFLRAVLSNLFQNAIKYSPEGEAVIVEVEGEGADCSLKVIDFGVGIAQEDRDKIFDAFYRGGNTGQISGTGLGLAVAKAALDRLGGRLTIASELGKGAAFELDLPGLFTSIHRKKRRDES